MRIYLLLYCFMIVSIESIREKIFGLFRSQEKLIW